MAKRTAPRLALGAVLALVSSACTVSSTTIPPLTGPSEFALSFALTATPDSIFQDGSSQSSITVTARDANAKSIPGLIFRLDTFVGNNPGDYGRLSGKTLVTGPDGRATAVYTAPPAPPAGSLLQTCSRLPGTCVTISATPVSTGFISAVSQTVVIHLVPVGVILPPADTPTASFVITPIPVTTNVATHFDGSASCAGSATGTAPNLVCSPTNNTIVSYSWGFGDGAAAMGRTASHSYSAPGTYTVTLTVTNDGGRIATATQSITVAASALPTPVFVFSPSTPVIGQVIQFNASASTAAAGRSIVNYVWNWGDGTPNNSGQTVSHSYTLAAAYNVTLTVTDDAGQSATITQTVNVGLGNPTAVLTVTKIGGTTVQADGSQSTASGGSSIVSYRFIWGDGSADTVGPASSAVHTYPVPVPPATSTFSVTLRVTDNAVPARSALSPPVVVTVP